MKIIKDIEKEYKIDFGVNPRMKLSTYLKRFGLPSMARALNRIENRLQPTTDYKLKDK